MRAPFTELGIDEDILKAIDRLGYETATPIQSQTIPSLLEGNDLVGQSQTGSGKTAAFAVPAIQLIDKHIKAPQVLILCPTRELAIQVSEEVHKLAAFKKAIHALPIYGGQSYERQFQGLKQGAQIVIGTPGRVMDHMRRGTLSMNKIKMVVLDECDEMLDMGFREDMELIIGSVPDTRQLVFFSATMPKAIQDIIRNYAKDPKFIKVEQKSVTVPTVDQVFFEVQRSSKLQLLTRLIDLHDIKLGIIFCNTKRMVDELTENLNTQGYLADALHGDMSQAQRDRVMNKFRKSGMEFLVATDVAARGIDISNVQVVFNYDVPNDPEDYVHRIGRTGRAGKEGQAITFVSGREIYFVQSIERFTKARMRRGRIPSPSEIEEKRMGIVLDKIRRTLEKGDYRKHDALVEILLEEGHSSTDIASALLNHVMRSQWGDFSQTRQPEPAALEPATAPRPSLNKPKESAGSNQKKERGKQSVEKEERTVEDGKMQQFRIETGPGLNITPREILDFIGEETDVNPRDIGKITINPTNIQFYAPGRNAPQLLEQLKDSQLKGRPIQIQIQKRHSKEHAKP